MLKQITNTGLLWTKRMAVTSTSGTQSWLNIYSMLTQEWGQLKGNLTDILLPALRDPRPQAFISFPSLEWPQLLVSSGSRVVMVAGCQLDLERASRSLVDRYRLIWTLKSLRELCKYRIASLIITLRDLKHLTSNTSQATENGLMNRNHRGRQLLFND